MQEVAYSLWENQLGNSRPCAALCMLVTSAGVGEKGQVAAIRERGVRRTPLPDALCKPSRSESPRTPLRLACSGGCAPPGRPRTGARPAQFLHAPFPLVAGPRAEAAAGGAGDQHSWAGREGGPCGPHTGAVQQRDILCLTYGPVSQVPLRVEKPQAQTSKQASKQLCLASCLLHRRSTAPAPPPTFAMRRQRA